MGCIKSFLPALHYYFIYRRNFYLDDRKFLVVLFFCESAPYTGSRTRQLAHEFGELWARLVFTNMNPFPITESLFSNLQSIPL